MKKLRQNLWYNVFIHNIDFYIQVRRYCHSLYRRDGIYGELARRTKLDRRTVKKYISDYNQNADDHAES